MAHCGWAVVDARGDSNRLIASGCLETKKTENFAARLAKIYNHIQAICRQYKIRDLAVESIFFAQNVKTAIVVAQTIGAVKAAADNLNVAVFEYTPLQIKIAITGYGRADKEQMIKMTGKNLANGDIIENNHAADAAAAALTHIFTRKDKNY